MRFKWKKKSVGLLGAEGEEKLLAAEKLVGVKIRELGRATNTDYWI